MPPEVQGWHEAWRDLPLIPRTHVEGEWTPTDCPVTYICAMVSMYVHMYIHTLKR